MISLVREANTARDGWPTSEWLLELAHFVEAIGVAMPVDGDAWHMRRRVMDLAGTLASGATTRETYPAGVSPSVDVERRRALDAATHAADGFITILPTLQYDAARAAEYAASRGWSDHAATVQAVRS